MNVRGTHFFLRDDSPSGKVAKNEKSRVAPLYSVHIHLKISKCFGNYVNYGNLSLLYSERPKLDTILAFLSAIGLNTNLTVRFNMLSPTGMHWS